MNYRYEDENGNPLSYRREMLNYIVASRHPWVSDRLAGIMSFKALQEVKS